MWNGKRKSSSNYPAAYDYADSLFQTFFLAQKNEPETSETIPSCWI